MVFTRLLMPTITILVRKWPNDRRALLPTNKTFEGVFLALARKYLQKDLWILSSVWNHSVIMKAIKFSFKLIYEHICQLNKVTQDLICICKQKTIFFTGFIDKFKSNRQLASPVKTSKLCHLLRVFGREQFVWLFVKFLCLLTAANREATLLLNSTLNSFTSLALRRLEVNQ